MSLRHVFSDSVAPWESGKIMKLSRDGEIEWEAGSWEDVRNPSSDTHLRFKCDGKVLHASGNIGRWMQTDNIQGFTVMECVERWGEFLGRWFGYMKGFGSRFQQGQAGEWGTYLTRLDLAGNFNVSDYSALCHAASVRRIGQRLPMVGKYGPTWGYDSKRGNWWKAKLYDKTAEAEGKRRSEGGETLARFEVQLGSQYLVQNKLSAVIDWRNEDMGDVIYGRFADQVFRESVSVEDWSEIPMRLRHYAVLWRDGVDIRTQTSRATYFRVRGKLLEFGIDIGTPCNVVALVRRSREVTVRQVSALRAA
jgi:hypothetical protein